MKTTLAAIVLLLPPPGDEGPRPADFIPADSQQYFNSAKGLKYWGPDTQGWRVGLSPAGGPLAYVDQGGRGEALELYLSVFTRRLVWNRDPLPESLGFSVRFEAPGLPDHVISTEPRRDGMSANDSGVEWSFVLHLPQLRELEQAWGRLPGSVRVTVTLNEKGYPPAFTSSLPLELKRVPQKEAHWHQLLATLRRGQTRDEVLALLGPALSETLIRGANGKISWKLVYPNPDAPADLPLEVQMSHVWLDADGRFDLSQFYGGC